MFLKRHLKCSATEAAELHNNYLKYLARIPVAGVALFDPQCKRLLLVKGCFKDCPWGFPKGKVDEGESLLQCAVRETREETGIDMTGQLREEHKIQLCLGSPKKDITLYIAVLRELPTNLAPQVQNEIGKIGWVSLAEVKTGLQGRSCVSKVMATPFWKPLSTWLDNVATDPTTPEPTSCSPCNSKGFRNAKKMSPLTMSGAFTTGEHTKGHWCLKGACLFSQMNFLTQAELSRHTEAMHRKDTKGINCDEPQIVYPKTTQKSKRQRAKVGRPKG